MATFDYEHSFGTEEDGSNFPPLLNPQTKRNQNKWASTTLAGAGLLMALYLSIKDENNNHPQPVEKHIPTATIARGDLTFLGIPAEMQQFQPNPVDMFNGISVPPSESTYSNRIEGGIAYRVYVPENFVQSPLSENFFVKTDNLISLLNSNLYTQTSKNLQTSSITLMYTPIIDFGQPIESFSRTNMVSEDEPFSLDMQREIRISHPGFYLDETEILSHLAETFLFTAKLAEIEDGIELSRAQGLMEDFNSARLRVPYEVEGQELNRTLDAQSYNFLVNILTDTAN